MAIAVVMDFEGATLDQYDQVIAKMNLTPGGAGAPGGLFHWAAATDGGIRIADVWNSRAEFDKIAQDQIGPITAEVGIFSPPQMSFYEVHSYMTAG